MSNYATGKGSNHTTTSQYRCYCSKHNFKGVTEDEDIHLGYLCNVLYLCENSYDWKTRDDAILKCRRDVF